MYIYMYEVVVVDEYIHTYTPLAREIVVYIMYGLLFVCIFVCTAYRVFAARVNAAAAFYT